MPKRRMHDGSMWENPKFARLTIRQRLLFCALIDAADDQGRMVADPALVRSKAFPFDDVALNDVADDVMALGGNGSILVYSNTNGDPILQITNWWKYQSPQWACPSSLPPPPGWQDRIRHRIGKDIIIKNWGGHEEPSASPVPELVQSVNKVHDESVQSTELVGTESVQCSSYGYGNDYGNVHDDAHAPLDPKAAITGTVFASWQNARGGATTALDCEQIGMLCDEYSPLRFLKFLLL